MRPVLIVGAVLTLFIAGACAQENSLEAVDAGTLKIGDEYYDIVGMTAPANGRRGECLAERLLGELTEQRLQLLVEGGVEIEKLDKTSQFRWNVRAFHDGRDVAEILIEEGYAVSVEEGIEFDWCARS